MSSSPKLKPNKWDALVALTVLILAVSLVLGQLFARGEANALRVRVESDSETLLDLPLAALPAEGEEHEISAQGYTLTLSLSREGAAVTHSDCPTQDCVHTGTVTRAGQSIVCLPAHVSVSLVGDAADYDLVTG